MKQIRSICNTIVNNFDSKSNHRVDGSNTDKSVDMSDISAIEAFIPDDSNVRNPLQKHDSCVHKTGLTLFSILRHISF